MNRYNMIFTPFTGKDNHGNCVTFGAGLLSGEDVESYSWMLKKFTLCMGRHPSMIVTDQDPALKIAVEQIMPGSRHRLCMWHIMEKVSSKIPRSVKEDTDFMKKFHELVWPDNTDPEEFEQNWHELIEFYDLADVDWFGNMFEIRQSWLPAYFRDFPMSGLFRTTSMSESMNSFFGSFARGKADLAEFLLHFDSAIDKQRHDYNRLTKEDITSLPSMMTDLAIERHAASVFTVSIFNKLQHSIVKACFSCRLSNISSVGDEVIYEIDQFSVIYNKLDKSVTCSCNKFIRMGFICSHMFTVFKNCKLECIPDAYIVNRWRKDACSLPVEDLSRDYVAAYVDSKMQALSMLHSVYYSLVGKVEGDLKEIEALTCYLQKYNESECLDGRDVVDRQKERLFEGYYGSTVPSEVSVLPPDVVKNKGSGSRLISRREKAIRNMNKPLRKCSKCKQLARHDARNCGKQQDA